MPAAVTPPRPAPLPAPQVVHFKCHRSLLSDALLARGCRVLHLAAPRRPPAPHRLTKFIRVDPGDPPAITYPPYDKAALFSSKEPSQHSKHAHAHSEHSEEGAEGAEGAEEGAGPSRTRRRQRREEPGQPRIDAFFQPQPNKKKEAAASSQEPPS